MPAARASRGERNWTALPSTKISPSSGLSAPEMILIRTDLPPIVADQSEDLAGEEVEIRMIERNHAAEALDQSARLHDRDYRGGRRGLGYRVDDGVHADILPVDGSGPNARSGMVIAPALRTSSNRLRDGSALTQIKSPHRAAWERWSGAETKSV